jgi:DNA-binding SARP family transcriptional activator
MHSENLGESRCPNGRPKLLALAPDHRVHRDQLIDVLSPDRDLRSGANNLYQAFSAARRANTSAGGDGHARIRLEDEWVTLCLVPRCGSTSKDPRT